MSHDYLRRLIGTDFFFLKDYLLIFLFEDILIGYGNFQKS